MPTKTPSIVRRCSLHLPLLAWLGGAVHTYNQPGCTFWDAIIWMYYLGRYAAVNFTVLS